MFELAFLVDSKVLQPDSLVVVYCVVSWKGVSTSVAVSEWCDHQLELV